MEIKSQVMTANAYYLVITGAAFLAYFQILLKRETTYWKGLDATLTSLYLLLGSVMLFGLTALTGGPQIHEGFWFAAIATGVLNIGFQFCRTRANALEDTSLVTPLLATTPAVVIFTSMVILNEYPSMMGWIGIWLLVIGGYILNIESFLKKRKEKGQKKWTDFFAPFMALSSSKGVRYAFVAAMIASVSLNYDGLAARTANIPFGLGVIYAIAGLGNLSLAWRLGEWKAKPTVVGRNIKKIFVLAMVYVIAVWFMTGAFLESIVPYVGAMKRIQIPFNAILAFLILSEKVTAYRFLGGAVMAIGAAAMGLEDQLLNDVLSGLAKLMPW